MKKIRISREKRDFSAIISEIKSKTKNGTKKEVAEKLKISPSTLRRWEKNGKPSKKQSKRIDRFLHRNKIAKTTEAVEPQSEDELDDTYFAKLQKALEASKECNGFALIIVEWEIREDEHSDIRYFSVPTDELERLRELIMLILKQYLAKILGYYVKCLKPEKKNINSKNNPANKKGGHR